MDALKTVAVAKVVRKRCPDDAVALVYQEWEGMMGWMCPRCGYFEPDMDSASAANKAAE